MRAKPCSPEIVDALKTHLGDRFVGADEVRGQTRITIDRSAIREALGFLKNNAPATFELLSDITAHDQSQMPGKEEEPRFVVLYTVFSISRRQRVILRCLVPEDDCQIDTSLGVYETGKWTEREVYEMFGVRFTGHPDLRRLLTPDYFDEDEQYPLRKEYPLRGIGDRYAFPVYHPEEELDLSRYGFDKNDDNQMARGALGRG